MASLPNVSPLLITFSTLLLISCSEAREFLVGGNEDDAWKAPLPSPDSLNQWARTQRFRIGDSLIFKYDNRTESVHVVNKNDYETCTTEGEHHVKFKDGNSKLWFKDSGPFHFISGEEGHCQMGLKLVVVVMSSKHGNTSHISPPLPPSLSLSPSPSALPPTSQGVARSSGGGFIGVMMGLGFSLVMMMFLI